MINFGKYDQKVSFVSFQSVSDGAGGTVPTPSTILTTFASVTQINAGNGLESGEMVLPNTYQIAIQYRNNFVPNQSYQVLYGSKYHKILGVQVNQQRQHKEYVLTIVGIQ